jgi:hypothetical protein
MSSASCLTVVSNFPAATFETFIGFCAVLDRTRWHVSHFRHGDDQIPSGGSFRAVPQQHSIFDLRVARGVRYRKGPVRCVPRYRNDLAEPTPWVSVWDVSNVYFETDVPNRRPGAGTSAVAPPLTLR